MARPRSTRFGGPDACPQPVGVLCRVWVAHREDVGGDSFDVIRNPAVLDVPVIDDHVGRPHVAIERKADAAGVDYGQFIQMADIWMVDVAVAGDRNAKVAIRLAKQVIRGVMRDDRPAVARNCMNQRNSLGALFQVPAGQPRDAFGTQHLPRARRRLRHALPIVR